MPKPTSVSSSPPYNNGKMSFLDIIEKIQQKPVKTREKILAASVIIIMAAVFLIWLETARRTFLETPPEKSAKELRPLRILSEALNQGTKTFKEQFNF